MLRLAEDLKLPLDAATQTFAFIARKGAGKTYAAGKLVELLLDAGVQVVVLDTVGNSGTRALLIIVENSLNYRIAQQMFPKSSRSAAPHQLLRSLSLLRQAKHISLCGDLNGLRGALDIADDASNAFGKDEAIRRSCGLLRCVRSKPVDRFTAAVTEETQCHRKCFVGRNAKVCCSFLKLYQLHDSLDPGAGVASCLCALDLVQLHQERPCRSGRRLRVLGAVSSMSGVQSQPPSEPPVHECHNDRDDCRHASGNQRCHRRQKRYRAALGVLHTRNYTPPTARHPALMTAGRHVSEQSRGCRFAPRFAAASPSQAQRANQVRALLSVLLQTGVTCPMPHEIEVGEDDSHVDKIPWTCAADVGARRGLRGRFPMTKVTEIAKRTLPGALNEFELAVLDEQVRSRLNEAYRDVALWRHVRRVIEELKLRRDQDRPRADTQGGA